MTLRLKSGYSNTIFTEPQAADGDSMKLSENFSRSEFACKCGCGQDTVDVVLIEILELVRDHFNQPITINSGNRCTVYNESVGGAKNSQHLKGRAADITVKGHAPSEVHAWLDAWHKGGLGKYDTFTHVDSRKPTKTGTRWFA